MGAEYKSVLWNKQKKKYNIILWSGIGLILLSFVLINVLLNPTITPQILVIRSSSLVAITLLHIILIIGPLSRLNSAFLPMLYNRRHLGVTMFVFAAIHSIFSIIQFHSLGDINPLASIFLSNTKYSEISNFPFQVLGFFALIILFLMAATSHDFWLKNLGPKVWKGLHMMVYVAYALLILHIALGILQYENKPIYWIILVMGFLIVASLHLISGLREANWLSTQKKYLKKQNFYEVAHIDEIPEDCAKGVFVDGENIAIFKYGDKISAVSNVCRHQMGPLAEGRIIDGCITCPWHGYQYKPEDGKAPPPFTEKLETYQTKIVDHKIWVNPIPISEGT